MNDLIFTQRKTSGLNKRIIAPTKKYKQEYATKNNVLNNVT
jgi:hypothetical protein